MQLHANARTCPKSRRLIVARIESGWSLAEAAAAAGVSERTVSKWLARWRAEGEAGLLDRSSAPKRVPHRTPSLRVEAIVALRRLRMTAAEIAELLSMALSTVSAVLRRVGLGKLSRLDPPEPPNRYEHARPGALLHLDVKKLGRILSPGHRVVAHRRSQKKIGSKRLGAAGWESCTSASTTPPGWPTPKSCATSAARAPSASCAAQSPGSKAWASSPNECSATTALA